MHAMRDRERECTHTVAGVTRQTNKQNNLLLSSDGEWLTVGLVVVGRYTQTRQRWLRAKIVKSGHDKHYKGAFAMYRMRDATIQQ